MQLRDYQQEAVAASVAERQRGIWAQLVVLPTGSGKTPILAALPDAHHIRWGQESVLVLCHMEELIWQAAEKMSAWNPRRSVEIEKAEDRACPRADIVVASIPSLLGRSGAERLGRMSAVHFGIVICDEAHIFLAPGCLKILETFRVLKAASPDRSRMLLGTTATAFRSDNQGLEKVFQKIVYYRPMEWMVERGWLASPHAWSIRTEARIADVKIKRGGEFDDHQLSVAINTPDRNRVVVEGYREHGMNLPGLAFTVDVQHACDLAQSFRDAGIPAWPISGQTGRSDRQALFRGLRDGSVRVLTSCQALGIGTDLPYATVGMYTRPFRHPLPLIQQFGRVMRPWPSPEDRAAARFPRQPKPYAIHLDFVDNFGNHRIQTVPTLFGLRINFDPRGKSLTETVQQIRDLGVSLGQVDNLEQARHFAEMVDVMAPARSLPSELRAVTKLSWVQSGDSCYRLQRPSDKSVYEVRVDTLGGADLLVTKSGAQAKIGSYAALKQAVKAAERMIPWYERRMVSAFGGWRSKEPKDAQIQMLYGKDRAALKAKFGDLKTFRDFVLSEFQRGNQSFNRGGISDRISMLTVAKG